MNGMKTRRYQADGLELAADVGGEPGDPMVLLLHGGGQTRHSWGQAARSLIATHHQVVSLDLRGHGESDWAGDGNYSLDCQIRDLRCVLDQLPAQPSIVGASLGGLIALLAVGEAECTIARRLVLVDVAPKVDPEGVARILGFMRQNPEGFADPSDAADAVAAYLPHRPRPATHSGLERNLRRREDGRWYWHWDPALFDRLNADPQLQLVRFEKAARRVHIPTLLMRGQLSELVNDESVQHFLGLIPGARSVNVADARHMIAGDQNDAFNAELLDFLHEAVDSAAT